MRARWTSVRKCLKPGVAPRFPMGLAEGPAAGRGHAGAAIEPTLHEAQAEAGGLQGAISVWGAAEALAEGIEPGVADRGGEHIEEAAGSGVTGLVGLLGLIGAIAGVGVLVVRRAWGPGWR